MATRTFGYLCGRRRTWQQADGVALKALDGGCPPVVLSEKRRGVLWIVIRH